MPATAVRLTAEPGSFDEQELYLGDDILLYRYPEGDCDCIQWPNPDKAKLASCLYGEFECGNLKTRTVELPDGTTFDIDEHVR